MSSRAPVKSEKVPIPAQNATSNSGGPIEDSGDWVEKKTKTRVRPTPAPELKIDNEIFLRSIPAPEAGEEALQAAKRFAKGFVNAQVGMLEHDQINTYFRDLREAAVKAHFDLYGEEDKSYLKAEIDINIPKTIIAGPVPHFGIAICHIIEPPESDHKMYWVFLGRYPDGSMPKEEEQVDPRTGETRKFLKKFIQPYKPEMDPDQVDMWVVHQEQKFTAKKISQETIELTREAHATYKALQAWEAIKNSFLGLRDDDFEAKLEEHSSLLDDLVYEAVKISPAEEEEVRTRFEKMKDTTSGSEFLYDMTHEVEEDKEPEPGYFLELVQSKARFVSHVEIIAMPHHITIQGNGSTQTRLCIQNAPDYIDDAGLAILANMFGIYNTMKGSYGRSYESSVNGNNVKIPPSPYPHVFRERDPVTKYTVINIAFTDSNNGDGAYAMAMRRKFIYEGMDKGMPRKEQLLLEFWPGDKKLRYRDRDSNRGRGGYSGGPRNRPMRDTPENMKARSPKIASLPRGGLSSFLGGRESKENRQAPRPMVPVSVTAPSREGPAPVSVTSIFDIASGEASDATVISKWTTGKLNLNDIGMRDENGDLVKPLVYRTTIGEAQSRGYDANRRDDGNTKRYY
jgi:hypothetical protein